VRDLSEQIAVINVLPAFLEEHKDVRLVVLDSIAFHFRHSIDNMAKRRYLFKDPCREFLK